MFKPPSTSDRIWNTKQKTWSCHSTRRTSASCRYMLACGEIVPSLLRMLKMFQLRPNGVFIFYYCRFDHPNVSNTNYWSQVELMFVFSFWCTCNLICMQSEESNLLSCYSKVKLLCSAYSGWSLGVAAELFSFIYYCYNYYHHLLQFCVCIGDVWEPALVNQVLGHTILTLLASSIFNENK